MIQELTALKKSILEQRYEDALALIDDLEGMSKQAIIRNIESYLDRLFIHLIKNQIEQRLTNSWAASIADSLRQIQKLNLKANKQSYYLPQNEWQDFLEEALEAAITPASVEVLAGTLTPWQISEQINRPQLLETAQTFINLTYLHSKKELPREINQQLAKLVGGEDWYQS
ncbi:DUF29 family protein [Spirulina sp. CS-785/01]|uniref:DUF29 family protein n=1 Tax=Spirulina sp. CS-785/01 TaxID=3021716 RepID=UPI00232C33FF|nr:DUF29 family protein [Spirulina sp. CS-785/01]MDB9315870.1 DUF29 family protein [Spirulina sp. CS-785/01]